jgi:hypothetical protein
MKEIKVKGYTFRIGNSEEIVTVHSSTLANAVQMACVEVRATKYPRLIEADLTYIDRVQNIKNSEVYTFFGTAISADNSRTLILYEKGTILYARDIAQFFQKFILL